MNRRILYPILGALLLAVAAAPAKASNWPELTVVAPDEAPSNFVDKDGKVTGFTTDVVRAIMAKLGKSWPIEIKPWSRIYKQAQTKPNIVLFRAARIPKRENLFQWVGPISVTPMILFAKSGSGVEVQSVDDARAVKRIAVMKNDVREQMLQGLGFENLDASIDHTQGLKKLLGGRVDLWASAGNAARKRMANADRPFSDIRPTVTFGYVFGYVVVSKQTDPSVVKRWQEALDAIKADGTFEGIARKWADIQKVDVEITQSAAHFKPR